LTFGASRHMINVMTIRSFKDPDTEAIFNDQPVVRFQAIQQAARRKLLVLDAATELRARERGQQDSIPERRSGTAISKRVTFFTGELSPLRCRQ
jgi:hypothetical protein